MRRLALACALSVLLYLLVFVVLLHKPLTTGTVLKLEARRDAYAAAHPGPKIIIIAGSNGLYSFRCETIAPIVHRPCVNMSIGAQAGLNYDLVRVSRILESGDVVLMPYEFEVYTKPTSMLYGGLSSEWMAQYDRRTLRHIPTGQAINALFSFDFRFLMTALAESLFAAAGVAGNFTVNAFTPQGDYAAGSAALARTYQSSLRQQDMATPDANVMARPAEALLTDFFDLARNRGATVIGTLPTTFDDRPHRPDAIARIAAFYRGHGAYFLVLPNQDQYPRSCFLDSHYHLATLCQIAHSTNVGRMLGAFLHDRGAAILGYAPRAAPSTTSAAPNGFAR